MVSAAHCTGSQVTSYVNGETHNHKSFGILKFDFLHTVIKVVYWGTFRVLRSPIQCRQERGHDDCGDRELSVRVNWYFMTTLADTSTGAALYKVRHNPQSNPHNPRHATDNQCTARIYIDIELSANLHEVSQCPEKVSTILWPLPCWNL